MPLIGVNEFKRRFNQLIANAQLYNHWASLLFVLGEMHVMVSENEATVYSYDLGKSSVPELTWFVQQGFYVSGWTDNTHFIVLK